MDIKPSRCVFLFYCKKHLLVGVNGKLGRGYDGCNIFSFGKDKVEKKLLNVYLCICKFESIPLFNAAKCDQWNL